MKSDTGFASFVVSMCTALLFPLGVLAQWEEVEKLTASDGEQTNFFGRSVSVSGDVAIVGAFRHDHLGPNAGAAYVYRCDTVSGTWVEQELTARAPESGPRAVLRNRRPSRVPARQPGRRDTDVRQP